MKVIVFIVLSVLFFACKQETTQTVSDRGVKKTMEEQDTIPLRTFLEWTANWEQHGKSFTDTLLVKYFDMPLIDLEEVIGETPAKSRFFMGLEDLGGGHYEAHLILAGLNESGQVIGSYFDITQPCPPYCGQSNAE